VAQHRPGGGADKQPTATGQGAFLGRPHQQFDAGGRRANTTKMSLSRSLTTITWLAPAARSATARVVLSQRCDSFSARARLRRALTRPAGRVHIAASSRPTTA
jgi:hypothetical protein